MIWITELLRRKRMTRRKSLGVGILCVVVSVIFGYWGFCYGQGELDRVKRFQTYDDHVRGVVSRQSLQIEQLERRVKKLESLWQETFGQDFDPDKIRSTTVEASSYNPLPEQTDDSPFIASFNNVVKPGILAVPKHYRLKMGWKPFQIIMVEGIGPMQVADHMNERYDANIDIICFIPEWSELWGRKKLKVWWQAG